MYHESNSRKRISSMKSHQDFGVTQAAAWFMSQRIREGLVPYSEEFGGPVEVDEAYFGGLGKDKHDGKKASVERGSAGNTAMVGLKDRATKCVSTDVIASADQETLNAFIDHRTRDPATVYTNNATTHEGRDNHQYVGHSTGEYVRGQAHINDIESFCAVLKRAYHGVYHHLSPKYLNRYVAQFAGKNKLRNLETEMIMQQIVVGMVGRRALYKDLSSWSYISDSQEIRHFLPYFGIFRWVF